MGAFSRARFTLTLWYTLIAYLLLGLFTLAALTAEHQAFTTIAELIQGRVHGLFFNVAFGQELAAFEANFKRELLLIDLGLLVFSAVTSWFLSGKTLRPIEAMVEQQRLFAADASHELRTPLANMSLEIEAFERTEPSIAAPTTELLTSLQAEIRRMTNIVDSLLQLVRSERIEPIHTEPVNLSDITSQAVLAMQHQLTAKHLKLSQDIQPNLLAKADATSFRQVLLILLDNAVKYTPTHGLIEVQLYQTDHQIISKVRNSGPGIAESDLPHIFERFYRGRQDEAGSGLGLAIAKQLVEAQHGQIQASSARGMTAITLSLPQAETT